MDVSIFSRGLGALALAATVMGASACTSIRDHRGYIADNLLYNGIQQGIDNQRSVEATLGRPTFTSQYGQPTWYYVSNVTGQQPFGRPKIKDSALMAITFDGAGNVASIERLNDVSRIAYLTPDRHATPTLGRERGFLEDLFGNIGAVGAGAGTAGAPGGG